MKASVKHYNTVCWYYIFYDSMRDLLSDLSIWLTRKRRKCCKMIQTMKIKVQCVDIQTAA